jgi:hypothetical protein
METGDLLGEIEDQFGGRPGLDYEQLESCR